MLLKISFNYRLNRFKALITMLYKIIKTFQFKYDKNTIYN